LADNAAVFGIYPTKSDIEKAIVALQTAGFRSAAVSVLMPGPGSDELITEKSSKVPEGAATGASSGAVIGGALGRLAGIGALALPGFGLIAAGPIAAALAGVDIGSTLGGIAGALIGLGIPEYEARRYEGHVVKGGCLLSVHCLSPYRVQQAKEIIVGTGGQEVSTTSEISVEQTRNTATSTGGSKIGEPGTEHSPIMSGPQELPSSEEIRNRAYEIYLARGASHGGDLDDWLEAERELKAEYHKGSVTGGTQAATASM
jgi:hypothetical protein